MVTKPEEELSKEPMSKSITATSPQNGENIAAAGLAIAIASIFTNFFTLGVMALAGLILSVIGRVQTKRAGRPSSIALAGIIISSVVMFLTLMAFVFFTVLAIMGGNRHQVNCDAMTYMQHESCDPRLFDERSEPPQERRLRVNPDTL